jgi:hypothetical protein
VRRGICAVVTAVALAGGLACGGDESAGARRAARRWADALCGALAGWADGDGGTHATLRLRARVLALDPAEGDDGLLAQGEAERLVESIPLDPTDGELADLRTNVRGAVDGFRGLTSGGAVERALARRPACERLRRR